MAAACVCLTLFSFQKKNLQLASSCRRKDFFSLYFGFFVLFFLWSTASLPRLWFNKSKEKKKKKKLALPDRNSFPMAGRGIQWYNHNFEYEIQVFLMV